jgi:glutamate racemase
MAKKDCHGRVQKHRHQVGLSTVSAPDPMPAIGVFDSGVGGLSVLRALRQALPHERFVYVADAGHAPYGERDVAHVLARSAAIGHYLVRLHHVKALVVACNTATAAAIATLRATYPLLPIVGVEPALKPAAAQSRTGVVGVLATRSTLASEKFQSLLKAQNPAVRFVLQACDGLAAAIERADPAQIDALCRRYTAALGPVGSAPGCIDTVVLGCTHYPFVSDVLQGLLGPEVTLLDAGRPVAQRTAQLLGSLNASVNQPDYGLDASPLLELWTTGEPDALEVAARQWIKSDVLAHKALIE